MSGAGGQGRTLLRRCGRGLRFLTGILLGMSVAGTVALGALVWRLSEGPIEVAWLARQIEAQVNADDGARRILIGTAHLAWEGLGAVDRPLDIRLTDVRVSDPAGGARAVVPYAAISLSLRRLVLGEIAPRAILVRDARLRLIRDADGMVALSFGDGEENSGDAGAAQTLLSDLAQPTGDAGRMGRFTHLRIERAGLVVVDRRIGVTWRVPEATIDLWRMERGGVTGTADLGVAVGRERMRIGVAGEWGQAGMALRASLSPLRPAALAALAPAFAPLAAVDAPVSGRVSARFSPGFAPLAADMSLSVGGGAMVLPDTRVALAGAEIDAAWADDTLTLRRAAISWPSGGDGPGPVIHASGMARRGDAGFTGEIGLRVDTVRLSELPTLWPEGLAPNPRGWLVENLTDGIARDLRVQARFAAPADLSGVTLESVDGGLRAEGVTVHWLRPTPPLEGVNGTVAFDLSTMTIRTEGGGIDGITAGEGEILISGLDINTQTITIEAPVAGALPDVLRLLQHPRLKLFDKRPLDLRGPAGQARAQLSVFFPLLRDLDLDALDIRATAALSGVRLRGIAMGQDLEDGAFDMRVSTGGLRAGGTARVLGTPVRLTVDEDFRDGPPTQVLSRHVLSGTFDIRNVATLGVDLAPYLSGRVGVEAQIQARRNGQQSVTVKGDLAQARLAIAEMAWEKPVGTAARVEMAVALQNDRLRGVEQFRLDGEALSLRGRVTATREGQADRVELTQIQLGDSYGAAEITLPAAGRALSVAARGPLLDVSAIMARRHDPARPAAGAAAGDSAAAPFAVDARFDRVMLGPGRFLSGVAVTARHDGRVVAEAHATGHAGDAGAFEVVVGRGERQRVLRATAADAGALLRVLDATDRIQGGTLRVNGVFDDSRPEAPLSGLAEMDEFTLRDAPAMAKLLQGMTLYGLVEAVRGPGLAFTKMVAPFTLTDGVLALGESRVFNASLGLTATGRIDFDRDRLDLTGTIVPAYVFNSLLGNIPILGRLFSPEQGGGLFAARYTVRGAMDDPDVSINPLSALTPGFLRGLFGILDQGGDTPPASAPAPGGD